jgi:hypothetical protein
VIAVNTLVQIPLYRVPHVPFGHRLAPVRGKAVTFDKAVEEAAVRFFDQVV